MLPRHLLHYRFEVIFPTSKEVDKLGENWREQIRTLLGYKEGSGDQFLGEAPAPAASSIDSKSRHSGMKNRWVCISHIALGLCVHMTTGVFLTV